MTSQYLKSMESFFPPGDSEDTRREPVTWDMVCMLVKEANILKRRDVGVVIAVAYAALLRMGEATSTSKEAFDATEDLAERNLTFVPDFWNAERVEIQLGRSKTDRTGAKARGRPRVIPIDGNNAAPGNF